MTFPLLPDRALFDIRSISEAGLRHTCQLGTLEIVRLPNGEYTTEWVFDDPVECRMSPAGFRESQIAASQGVKVQWLLVFRQAQDVVIGQQAMVRGETDGESWQRLVEIVSDSGLTSRIHRRTGAIDVDLNQ